MSSWRPGATKKIEVYVRALVRVRADIRMDGRSLTGGFVLGRREGGQGAA